MAPLLLLLQRLSPSVKFQKFVKNFKNQNFDILFYSFLRIGT